MEQRVVKQGSILISEPYLGDENFERTVVLVCEHGDEGSLGFILNKPTEIKFDEVVPEIELFPKTLFLGGPVQQNSLHFIFRNKNKINDSVEIGENLYWGGDYDELLELIKKKEIVSEDFRFFLGYSGWSEGQLEEELKNNSWVVANADSNKIFDTPSSDLWRILLKEMGGKYKMYSNYPIDPRLN